MLSKVGRLKPIKTIMTKIPINLTLVNLTNIASNIFENITDTIFDITLTPTETIQISNVTKTGTLEIDSIDMFTLIIKSKIFTIILIIVTIFVGFGWIFRIIYNK